MKLTITRDEEYRRRLLDIQRARMGIGERRSGVHVSDTIMCARKGWAERHTSFVPEISDETVLTWMRGLSHEAILIDGVEQVRAAHCFACETTHPYTPLIAEELRCPTCGAELLVGTIDWITFVDATDFVPNESKSTLKSSRNAVDNGDMAWYVDQLKTYMWMHGRQIGRLTVFHVMGDYRRQDKDIQSNGPPAELVTYKVEWDEEAKEDWGEQAKRKFDKVTGETLPSLDGDSPTHDMICGYCVIGEMLPSGEPCENFPWVRNRDNVLVRRGSSWETAAKWDLDAMQKMVEELEAKEAAND